MKLGFNPQRSINHGFGLALLLMASVCQAQNGVLEIHGTITIPSCKLNALAIVLQDKQTVMNGMACGLTQNANNRLSISTIARIGEEHTVAGDAKGILRKTVTLTYE